MSTRIIGGVAYPITEIRNAIGMEWIPAVSVSHDTVATMGVPEDNETFLLAYDEFGAKEIYAWDGVKWFHLFGGSDFDVRINDGYLQYREHETDNWRTLIEMSALQGTARRIDSYAVTSGENGTISVSYSSAFPSLPMLVLECVPPVPHGVTVRKLTEAVDGFTAIVEDANAVVVVAQSVKAYVIAV